MSFPAYPLDPIPADTRSIINNDLIIKAIHDHSVYLVEKGISAESERVIKQMSTAIASIISYIEFNTGINLAESIGISEGKLSAELEDLVATALGYLG